MNRYKVTLNWHGEVLTFYTEASSKMKALTNAIYQLAEKSNRVAYSVRQYFLNGKNRYEVKEVNQDV